MIKETHNYTKYFKTRNAASGNIVLIMYKLFLSFVVNELIFTW